MFITLGVWPWPRFFFVQLLECAKREKCRLESVFTLLFWAEVVNCGMLPMLAVWPLGVKQGFLPCTSSPRDSHFLPEWDFARGRDFPSSFFAPPSSFCVSVSPFHYTNPNLNHFFVTFFFTMFVFKIKYFFWEPKAAWQTGCIRMAILAKV